MVKELFINIKALTVIFAEKKLCIQKRDSVLFTFIVSPI